MTGSRSIAAGAAEQDTIGFRADIQGLRAVAVVLVLAFHLWPEAVPGGYVGVDVFFVISGYLITGMLVREARRSGRVSLARFYARRIRRLLPAASVTLLLVGLASFLMLPQLRWQDTGSEIAASALYVENWWLVGESVDYLALDEAPSPVQHFWSLSLEEQFYIVWPLLIVAVLWVRRRSRWPLERLLWASLGALVVASLAHSVIATANSPAPAYFSSATRFWELGLGSLLSLSRKETRCGGGMRARILVWGGLAAIVASGLLYSNLTRFPGHAALLPTLGTAAIIYAAAPRQAGLLALAPMQYLGGLSYSLYLWHWPLIVFCQLHAGAQPGFAGGFLIAGLAIVLAHESKVCIEDPIRGAPALQRPLWRSYGMGAAAIASCVGVAAILHTRTSKPEAAAPHAKNLQYPGALALAPGARWAPAPIRPTPLSAASDRGSAYGDKKNQRCIQNSLGTEVLVCEYGPRDGKISVALVGDSHAAHWVPTFQELAATRRWHVLAYMKDSCAFADTPVYYRGLGRSYTECDAWKEEVLRRLMADRPSVVVLSQSPRYRVSAQQNWKQSVPEVADGLRRMWRKLAGAGLDVAVIQHTPLQSESILECMSAAGASIEGCSAPRKTALLEGAVPVAARDNPDAYLLDMTDQFCPGRLCLAAIGNVLVYRDANHMTATYARTLAPVLAARLEQRFAQLRPK